MFRFNTLVCVLLVGFGVGLGQVPTARAQTPELLKIIPVDAAARWEITLADGDVLLLGNPADPVRIAVRLGDEVVEDLGDRLIASRSIMDLPAVAGQIETGDPADALRIYKALQPLGARLEPSAAIEAVVEATFQLLARATHVAV